MGTVERAFQLARSGECDGIEDIRKQLRKEQYSAIDDHLGGASIKRQLIEAIAISRGKPSPYLGRNPKRETSDTP